MERRSAGNSRAADIWRVISVSMMVCRIWGGRRRGYIQHHDDHDHSHCKCCVNGEGEVGDVPHSAVEHKAEKKINIWLNSISFLKNQHLTKLLASLDALIGLAF